MLRLLPKLLKCGKMEFLFMLDFIGLQTPRYFN
jgi:hypothetical protein